MGAKCGRVRRVGQARQGIDAGHACRPAGADPRQAPAQAAAGGGRGLGVPAGAAGVSSLGVIEQLGVIDVQRCGAAPRECTEGAASTPVLIVECIPIVEYPTHNQVVYKL